MCSNDCDKLLVKCVIDEDINQASWNNIVAGHQSHPIHVHHIIACHGQFLRSSIHISETTFANGAGTATPIDEADF
jgi:hypothetical protein